MPPAFLEIPLCMNLPPMYGRLPVIWQNFFEFFCIAPMINFVSFFVFPNKEY